MDLQAFIKGTISSIARATRELQSELADIDVLVNPPALSGASKIKTTYEPENPAYHHRHLQFVEFDVAVTASEESTTGAEIGARLIQVLSARASTEASSGAENVSRVKFLIPLTLPPLSIEEENRKKAQLADVSR